MRTKLFLIMFLFSTQAIAHDTGSGWAYDLECCAEKDCAPVVEVHQQGSGLSVTAVVTNKLNMTGIITPQTLWKESKDNLDHACIINNVVRCFYTRDKI